MLTAVEKKRARWIGAIFVGLFVVAGAAVFVREYRKSVEIRGMRECQDWIRKIDLAKEAFGTGAGKTLGDAVTWEDLIKPGTPGFLGEDRRKCRHTGADYVLGKLGEETSCSSGAMGHGVFYGVVMDEATGKPKFTD